MRNPVKIQAIIEELEMQFDESRTFLNVKTGEIISVTLDDLRAAEDEEEFGHLPEWEQEDRKVARDAFENFENYKELPTKYEVNEYEIIEDFCFTVSDERKQDTLLSSIKGKGAFRRFKDKIIDFEMEDQWYSYRDERYKQIAIKWCLDNNINFIDN
ncbi:UPF0158 family protein [Peribacillus frigoritolerans]|nr:UPF0158 family protein [Peribacillus frigoritolerans]AZV61099.1 hypothetical protein DOZ91_11030 [Peribacillus frigoritolerans]MDM5304958.1 UPF0158 family protein [Peribacillus frigoritolerans]USK81318.1 UPF0158 family protein [Peribacillus frigoritolerans]WJE48599.1 UPF0158 family protein [Peribacillus frigoritolerans]